MTIVYKLTDSNDRTRNDTQWGEGVEHTAPGGGELCSGAYLHAYSDPLLAVLMAPAHVLWVEIHLWEAEAVVEKDDGTKLGCTRLRTIRRMELPTVTIEQRVRFAILCVKEVCADQKWNEWADKWLSGEDRSAAEAEVAWSAAAAAKWAATEAAKAVAAKWAATAKWAAAEAATAKWAEAEVAWSAATAAKWAATEVAKAVAAKWAACKKLDLVKIARHAMEEKNA